MTFTTATFYVFSAILIFAALRVVTHFRRHLDVEDRVVLPAAGRTLDADLLATVAAEMERRRTEGSCA